MPSSQPNEEKPGNSLPPGFSNLVFLPEQVSVRYLMEMTGATADTMLLLMRNLGVIGEISRSVHFDDAARILNRYGILAKRDSSETGS
jgi:hypothetical protein